MRAMPSSALAMPMGTSWRERHHGSAWTSGSAATLLILAALAGAGLGTAMTSPYATDVARELFGAAPMTSGEAARGALFGLLGLEITLIGLVLSASTAALYGMVANQSLRLVAYLEPSRPLFRAAVGFAITAGYVLAAVRRLGPAEVEAQRPALTVGVVIALATIVAVVVDGALSLRKQHISQIMRVVTTATRRTIATERARTRAWPAAPELALVDAALVRAPRSGFVRDVDGARLLREVAREGARVRIDRAIGEYVVEGEPLGRVSAPQPARAAEGVARALILGENRRVEPDVGLGLRVLVDIAERALSPAVNDPYTACEALFRLRGLLIELASVPDGDWVLADDAGTARAWVARASFDELVWLVVDGPCRYGAADPDVIDAVLDIASAIARERSRRECARRVVARVLEDAAASGMSGERLALLEEKARRALHPSGQGAAMSPRLWSLAERSSQIA